MSEWISLLEKWKWMLIEFSSKTYSWSFQWVLTALQGTQSFSRLHVLLIRQLWSLLDPKVQLSSSLTLRGNGWVYIRQSSDECILLRTQIIGLSNWFSAFPMFFWLQITQTERPFSLTCHPCWFVPEKYLIISTVIKKDGQEFFDMSPRY